MSVTSHRAGGWLAVVGSDAWALLDLPESVDAGDVVRAIEAGDLSKALDALTRSGVSATPDFAMASFVEDRLRHLVRGAGTVVVRSGESSETIVGYASPTWSDAFAPAGATEISLCAPISGTTGGAISGVSRAGELTVRLTQPAPAAQAPRTAQAPSTAIESGSVSTDDSSYESVLYELLTANTTTRDALAQALSETSRERPEEDRAAEAGSVDLSTPPAAEEAPVRAETATWQSTWQPQPEPQSSAPPSAPAVKEPVGIIDALPWAPLPPAPTPPANSTTSSSVAPKFFPTPTPAVPAPPMDPEVTRVRSALLQHLTDPAPAGPMVWAAVCPNRHWSPPYSPHCRVCGAPVAEQPPQQVARPVLGRLVVSTGAVVSLDRGVIFGRAPVSAAEAADRPHLIKLDGSEISRRHVEVRLEDWQVLVRDLGSGNGTTLALPGRAPERLRPNDEHALEPGSLLCIADLVTVTYEA